MVNCRLHGIGWVNKRANIRGSPLVDTIPELDKIEITISAKPRNAVYIYTYIYIL